MAKRTLLIGVLCMAGGLAYGQSTPSAPMSPDGIKSQAQGFVIEIQAERDFAQTQAAQWAARAFAAEAKVKQVQEELESVKKDVPAP